MSEKCLQSNSAEETVKIGFLIGSKLKGGEVIELVSDLGGGKTTLTKGITSGAGFSGNVTSPTFTVSNLYKGKKLDIHHYDFYRLGDLGVMSQELQEVLEDSNVVVIIEWAGTASKLLPKDRVIKIELSNLAENENFRHLNFIADKKLEYLLQDLKVEKC